MTLNKTGLIKSPKRAQSRGLVKFQVPSSISLLDYLILPLTFSFGKKKAIIRVFAHPDESTMKGG